MTPTEILTLAPLGALVVVFGLQPGLLLDLFGGTVTETLAAARPAPPIAIPTDARHRAAARCWSAGILARIAVRRCSRRGESDDGGHWSPPKAGPRQ